MKKFFCVISMCSLGITLFGQTAAEIEFHKKYDQRIKLTHIHGVYIPVDIQDAFREIISLSEPDALVKFQNGEESLVAQRLRGGIGRWMLINWGFFDGSRLSQYLKEQGLHHPEDMSQLLLVSFHRHLNKNPLLLDEQIQSFHEIRQKEHLARTKRDTLYIKQ